MREILFRGKRKDNGELFYGDLMQIPTHKFCSIIEQTACAQHREVIPETVGQYTGLVDHYGKKIFEGDIVEFGDTLGVINFSIGCYCVRTNKPYWRTQNNPAIDVVFNEYPNEVKVIGNIHDNPELLEVSQ